MVMGIVDDDLLAITRQDEDVAAIGLGKEPPVQDQVGGPLGDEAAVQEHGLMEPLRRANEVVRRGDDGLTRPRLGFQHVHEFFLRAGVDASHGFIQQVQVGISRDGARQEDPPSLSAGQGPDLPVAGLRHPDGLQRRGHPVPILASRAHARIRGGQSGPS